MHLVKVDPVGLQSLQRSLDLPDDPAPGVARLIGVLTHGAMELRGEHHAVAAPTGEGPADDLLRLPSRVDIGGVDEVDPGVQGPVDDAGPRLVVGLTPGAEHHRAETEGAYMDAGASECSQVHALTLALGHADQRLDRQRAAP